MSGACLGEVAAALVDGELGHAARERAQRHLAHCAPCRAEVEAQRRTKATLAALAPSPIVPPDLAARLLALPPGSRRVSGPVLSARPVTLRAAPGPAGTHPRGRRHALLRRTAVGSAVAALGVVAIALGAPQTTHTTPVHPGTDAFVVQHVDTTSEVPRAVRATLTGGSARGPR